MEDKDHLLETFKERLYKDLIPRSTQAFYNPFEEQVVQRTIDDVFKQGEIADIGQRARDISSGGESAFGSRARLGAEERRAALGRGLGRSFSRYTFWWI